jgi:hypothetical protein
VSGNVPLELRSLMNRFYWETLTCEQCRYSTGVCAVTGDYHQVGIWWRPLYDKAAAVRGWVIVGGKRLCWECFRERFSRVSRANPDLDAIHAATQRARFAEMDVQL